MNKRQRKSGSHPNQTKQKKAKTVADIKTKAIRVAKVKKASSKNI